jgi:hypothetical protein
MAFLARATCSSSKAGSSSPTPARSVSAPDSAPQVPAESVRTHPKPPMIGSPEAPDRCQICGRAMRPRKGKAVCGAACRRERSRRREADARRARDHEVRMLLETALRKLAEGPA